MKLTLYYAPNTCALVPYVTLTESGAAFDVVPLNFRKREHRQGNYLKINPLHKVPTLVIDDEPLTENVAIQLWIARNFPSARLLPQEPLQELRAISLMCWCAADIHPHLSRFHGPAKYCDMKEAASSIRKIAAEHIFENLRFAEERLAGREFFFEQFGAIDAYFFWCFRRVTQYELPLSGFDNCMAHFSRTSERASVRQVLEYEQQLESAFTH